MRCAMDLLWMVLVSVLLLSLFPCRVVDGAPARGNCCETGSRSRHRLSTGSESCLAVPRFSLHHGPNQPGIQPLSKGQRNDIQATSKAHPKRIEPAAKAHPTSCQLKT